VFVSAPQQKLPHRVHRLPSPNLRAYDPDTHPFSYAAVETRAMRQAVDFLVKGRGLFWGETRQTKEQTPAFRTIRNGVSFLDDYARNDLTKPFFLTVSLNPPHFPHYLPPDYARIADNFTVDLPPSIEDGFLRKPWFQHKAWWPCMDTSPLTTEEWRTVIAYSWAHLMMVDDAIGQVLSALDQLGLTDETIVIFAADHGDMQGAHNRFDKGPYFYDEIWRIRQPGNQGNHGWGSESWKNLDFSMEQARFSQSESRRYRVHS